MTLKEAEELGKRNFRYRVLCTMGLKETADILWSSWKHRFFRTIRNRSK